MADVLGRQPGLVEHQPRAAAVAMAVACLAMTRPA